RHPARGTALQSPATAAGLLSHGVLYPHDPELRYCRIRVEADPLADLGRDAGTAEIGGTGLPVPAVARQGGICADHPQPDLELAVHRRADDADLRRAALDSRRGAGGRRVR